MDPDIINSVTMTYLTPNAFFAMFVEFLSAVAMVTVGVVIVIWFVGFLLSLMMGRASNV